MVDEARARKPTPAAGRASGGGGWRRAAVRTWMLRVGSSFLIWTAVVQLTSVWQPRLPRSWPAACFDRRSAGANATVDLSVIGGEEHGLSGSRSFPPALLPRSESRSLLFSLSPTLHLCCGLIRLVLAFSIPCLDLKVRRPV